MAKAETRRRLRTETDEEKVFAKRIAMLLKELEDGVSGNAFATDIGISKAALSSYKQGTTVPDLITARRMSEVFGVSIDYIAGLTDKKSPDITDRAATELYGLSDTALTALKKYQTECEKDGVFDEALVGLNELFETSAPHQFLALICRYLTYLFQNNNYVEISDNLDVDVPNSFGKMKLGHEELEKLLILDKMTEYLVEERAKSEKTSGEKTTLQDIAQKINIKYGSGVRYGSEQEAGNEKTDKKREK